MTALPRTSAAIERGMSAGLHIGAQLYVSTDGKAVTDLAFGEARPGVPMTPDTLMVWLSAGKPITAVAIAQLWERGLLGLDDLVVRYIPEFGPHGKDRITIRQLLTHTAGIRGVANAWTDEPWDTIIARICAARPEPGWVPGEKAGYHLASSWYVLGEIVRRVSGRPLDQFAREEIFQPLGMKDSWLALPPERYAEYGQRIGWMRDDESNQGPDVPNMSDDTMAGAALLKPGRSARGPARELGYFYEALLAGGVRNGTRILSPETVRAMTTPQRLGMFDRTFKHVMDWGLGFIIDSKRYDKGAAPYGYGAHASPRAFGHGGSQSSTGFADPEHGLAVALIFNGRCGEERHDQRLRSVLAALYEDLHLTT